MPSRCLLLKFLHRSSVGGLLRVICWLEKCRTSNISLLGLLPHNLLVRVIAPTATTGVYGGGALHLLQEEPPPPTPHHSPLERGGGGRKDFQQSSILCFLLLSLLLLLLLSPRGIGHCDGIGRMLLCCLLLLLLPDWNLVTVPFGPLCCSCLVRFFNRLLHHL